MKKAFIILVLVLVGLAVFLPFASRSPDGLEKVTSTLGTQKQASAWQGLMPNYSVGAMGNSYVSTLLAGIFGTTAVLAASLLVGKVLTSKKR